MTDRAANEAYTETYVNGWSQYLNNVHDKDIPGLQYHFSGSRIISPDEVTYKTDLDIAIYVPYGELDAFKRRILGLNFTYDTSEQYEGLRDAGFFSFKQTGGPINIVLTSDAKFYRKHKLATDTAKVLGLKGKPARVAWFRKILYGESLIPVQDSAPADPVVHTTVVTEYAKAEKRAVLQDSRVDFTWHSYESRGGLQEWTTERYQEAPKIRKPPVDWRQEQASKHKGRPR